MLKPVQLFLAAAIVVAVVCVFLPAIPQSPDYHNFADHRAWLGISNFGDVASNFPFAIVGIWGLVFVGRLPSTEYDRRFVDPWERWPYLCVFFGMLLTAFGSAYYHLAPDNDRLVWDRLPMTIVFMSMVAAVIMERVSVRLGLALWPVLLLVGISSVVQWHLSEVRGHGDLRFYGAVQAYSILVLLLTLLLRSKYTRRWDFAVVVALYILAKVLETYDRAVFSFAWVVSGHTLKHLAAAAAGYWILRMVQKRTIQTQWEGDGTMTEE